MLLQSTQSLHGAAWPMPMALPAQWESWRAQKWRHDCAGLLNIFGGVLIWKRRAEEALERSGMNYVIVRPGESWMKSYTQASLRTAYPPGASGCR